MSADATKPAAGSKNPMFLSALILAGAALIYLFAVQPAQMSIAKNKRELASLSDQQRIMERDLKDSARVKGMLAEIDAAQKPFLDALLTPLLESWAMRAKSLLDPIAADVGLTIVDYSEQPVRALPLPTPQPRQLHARRPIRVVCRGSYAEIASFLLRVEKLLPHVALQSLLIKAQKDPDAQTAEIVLEWPAKGEMSVPVPQPGGGAKK
jgi:hypothetical protein